MQSTTISQNEISNAVANYYAASASAYYSSNEITTLTNDGIDTNSQEYLTKYELDDNHHNNFLNATAELAAQVPDDIRVEVLNTDDLWNKIQEDTTSNSDIWFDHLDKTTNLVYSRMDNANDPLWAKSGLIKSLWHQF